MHKKFTNQNMGIVPFVTFISLFCNKSTSWSRDCLYCTNLSNSGPLRWCSFPKAYQRQGGIMPSQSLERELHTLTLLMLYKYIQKTEVVFCFVLLLNTLNESHIENTIVSEFKMVSLLWHVLDLCSSLGLTIPGSVSIAGRF